MCTGISYKKRNEDELVEGICLDEELQNFKEAISEQENLKCRTDDIFLLSFLRSRKFDQERALELLRNYYNARKKYPQLFKELYPSVLNDVLDKNIICFVPYTDDKSPLKLLFKIQNWDPDVLNIMDLMRCFFLFLDNELNDHPLQTNGLITLSDMTGLSWKHVYQMTPNVIHSIVVNLFSTHQVRYNAIHIIYINGIVQALFELFMPFFPKKIKERLHFHSTLESLHEHIASDQLPVEYGGEITLNTEEYNEKLRRNEDLFRKSEEYWTVEVDLETQL